MNFAQKFHHNLTLPQKIKKKTQILNFIDIMNVIHVKHVLSLLWTPKIDKEQGLGHTSRTGWEVYFGLIIFCWNIQVVYLEVIVVVLLERFKLRLSTRINSVSS